MNLVPTRSAFHYPSPLALAVGLALTIGLKATPGVLAQGTAMGPGVAGQSHAAAYDPTDANTIYVGSDVAGVLVTHDHGLSWQPWNEGLENTQWASTMYVDGLAVIRSGSAGYIVPPGRQGVYAATHGGIYFRPIAGTWQLQTNYAANGIFRYTGTFLTNRSGIVGLYAPVPFSCMVFDESNGVLYAGAGHGRWYDGAHAWDGFYPDSGATSGTYSLWRCELKASGDGLWHPVVETENLGKVRQIAILGTGSTARPVFASSKGVFTPNVAGAFENIWAGRAKSLEPGINWSGDAWGVGVGKDDTLYCVMAAQFADVSGTTVKTANPNVYKIDAADPLASWSPLTTIEAPVYPLRTGETVLPTWGSVIAPEKSNLMRLTVEPGGEGTSDTVYVGERSHAANCGYLRYGTFGTQQGPVTGWIRLLYLTDASGAPFDFWDDIAYWGINPFTSPVTVAQIHDVGWASNYAITPTIPLLICPSQPDRMFAFAYHLPVALDSAAAGWQQRNCTSTSGDFWKSRGLNMMSVAALEFTPSRKLVVGCLDFGLFATQEGNYEHFQWLNWYDDDRHRRSVVDVEVLPGSGERSESILAVRPGPVKWVRPPLSQLWFAGYLSDDGSNNRQQYVLAASDLSIGDPATLTSDGFGWRYLSRGLDTAFDGVGSTTRFKIVDVEVVDSTTVFVALTKDRTGHEDVHASRVYKGTIGADWNVSWERWWSADSLCQAVELKHLPRSGKILVAASRDSGGVFCLDVDNNTIAEHWLSASDPTVDGRLALALRYLTCIAVDRLERVVYIGTQGEYTSMSGSRRIGAVLRLTLPSGRSPLASDWEMIANGGANNSFSFVAPSAPGFWPWPTEDPQDRLTDVQALAVDPDNPYVIYAGLRQGGMVSMGTFAPTNGAWKFTPNGASGTWTRVFPAGVAAGPSAGVTSLALDPAQSTRMVVGTYGQELYSLTIAPSTHPDIAASASHPLLAAITDTAQVLAVHIAAETTVVTVEAALDGLGLPGAKLILRDDGQGEDVAEGDGVFTSPRFLALLTAGTGHSVRVFAQDASGGYDEREVAVEAVAGYARFVDVSKGTGDLYSSLPDSADHSPYSSIYFNATGDPASKKVMVITFDDNVTAPQMFERRRVQNSAPWFERRSGTWDEPRWISTLAPGSRGLAWADFDNDANALGISDTDFFICNPASGGRLYRSHFAQGAELFTDVTDSLFGAGAGELAGAVTAAWGHFDSDNFSDLAVATATYVNPIKNLAGNTPNGSVIKIFRNVGGTHFELLAHSGNPGGPNICLSMDWADLDQDGDEDLVTWHFLTYGGAPFVMLNLGHDEVLGRHLMMPWSLNIQGTWAGGMSVCEIDYDHDQYAAGKSYPDLLVTESYGQRRAMILRNLMGDGSPTLAFEAIPLASGRDWSGAVAKDLDLNGQIDALVLAQDGQPEMHMGTPGGASPTYRDLAFTAGLRPGATSGALTQDFNDDSKPDLYLGRIRGDQFLYRSAPVGVAGAGPAHWLRVNLGTVGNSDRSLLGTAVTVTSGGISQTRVVSGGGDRGGQPSNELLFGLGAAAGSAEVTVRYRSGEIDQFTTPVDTTVVAIEDQPVVLKPSTKNDPNPVFSYELAPGIATWVFRWRTVGIKGDLAQDVVHVQNHLQYEASDPCYIGIAPGAVLDLKLNDPGVAHTVYRSGAYWQHEVRWGTLPCQEGCSYRFWVTSGLDNGVTVSSTPKPISPIVFCIPELPPE